MTIVLPGILFWFILLILAGILFEIALKTSSQFGILFFGFILTIGTIAYIVYAFIWIIEHWNIHITLT